MFNFQKRIDSLRAVMKENRLDAFVTSFLPHIRYLTGFCGSNALCILTRSEEVVLTDFRYKEQIHNEVRDAKSFVVDGSLFAAAAKRNLFNKCKRVGFEKDHLVFGAFAELKKESHRSIRTGKDCRWIPVSDIVESIASIKDEEEISCIKRAAAISDVVFSEILSRMRAGISECDVAAEISYLQRQHGAESDSFEAIVASGIRGALPHAKPTPRKIRKGEMVTLDFGCVYRGYCSDLTRTIAFGTPKPAARKIYSIVLDAQRKAIEAARPGLSARLLDATARSFITSKGYGNFFGHGLGHGIGLQIHESPKISSSSADMIRLGNAITIEPGIYIRGIGGVRIEDDVVIRREGPEVITTSPKELIVV